MKENQIMAKFDFEFDFLILSFIPDKDKAVQNQLWILIIGVLIDILMTYQMLKKSFEYFGIYQIQLS